MRHRKHTFKIGRTSGHRKALLANAVCSLIEHASFLQTVAEHFHIIWMEYTCVLFDLVKVGVGLELCCLMTDNRNRTIFDTF